MNGYASSMLSIIKGEKMDSKMIVKKWFDCWKDGHYYDLPITGNFQHTSPFGTINGKDEYLNIVKSNLEKFLGYSFDIKDEIYGNESACVRYKAVQNDFSLDVSEWYYFDNGLIEKIFSYYHIGEIRDARKLSQST